MAATKGLRAKSIGHYILGKTIGEGTFGKVKAGTHILSGEKVAVKILEKDRIVDVADVERVAREIHILKLMQHPHVIQLYEIIETPRQLYLIMEYCSGGELFDHIVAAGRVREPEACIFFHQILAGVERIHQMHVVHRDLKPENLLLDDRNNIKIVDFGLSNTFQEGQLLKTACGSPCYAAPEMIAGHHYVPSRCDVWSCGVILFALVCGYLPFEDQNTSALYRKILNAEYSTPPFLSEGVKDLIGGLLTIDPERRMTVPQVRMHPWYRQLPEASLKSSGGRSEHLEEDVVEQLEKFGFSRDYAVKCLQMNKHNHVTSTYYLLIAKKLRMAEQLGSPVGDTPMVVDSIGAPYSSNPHGAEGDIMDDLMTSPPGTEGFVFPMAAFDSVPGSGVGGPLAGECIPADADRAGGSNLLVQPSPRVSSPNPNQPGHCTAGGGVGSNSTLRQQQQQQWAQESPRGVRAMVAAVAAVSAKGHHGGAAVEYSTQPAVSSARGVSSAGARSNTTPRAETPPLAMATAGSVHGSYPAGPSSARGTRAAVPTKLWAQEPGSTSSRPVTSSGAATARAAPRRSVDGSGMVGATSSGLSTTAGSSRPSVRSRTEASAVNSSTSSGYRTGTPVMRSVPFNDVAHTRPSSSMAVATPARPSGSATARGQTANEARRRQYGTSSDGLPGSARGVRGPGATDFAASSWTMRTQACPQTARPGSVVSRVFSNEPRGSSLTAAPAGAANAGNPAGPLSARMPRDEVLASSRGAHTSSCTTSKPLKHIQQEMNRTLTSQRVTFKQVSPTLVKCQKLNVRFELEISQLEHLESIHVVRCRRVAGEVAAFREISTKLFAEMKI